MPMTDSIRKMKFDCADQVQCLEVLGVLRHALDQQGDASSLSCASGESLRLLSQDRIGEIVLFCSAGFLNALQGLIPIKDARFGMMALTTTSPAPVMFEHAIKKLIVVSSKTIQAGQTEAIFSDVRSVL